MQKVVLIVIAAFLAFAAIGLFIKPKDPTGPSLSEMTWEEDISLASGESVRFKRHMRFKQKYSWGMQSMSAMQVQEATLDLVKPDNTFVRWSAPIMPFYIDRDPGNGEWIVIAAADGRNFWSINGEPCPPQWGFRLRNGTWYLIPVPKPLLGRHLNLLADLNVTDDAELSPSAFQAIVKERKDRQYKDRGFRLIPTMQAVGEIYNYGKCRGKEPAFTRVFFESDEMADASLAKFPRLQ
jgi:hypothetical protein